MLDVEKVPGTVEELVGLMTEHSGWITRCLGETHDSWAPTLAVLMRDTPVHKGGISIYRLHVPFNEHCEKRDTIRGIGRRMYDERHLPAAAVMSGEAWVAPDPGPGKLPADSPDRREAIVVAGSTLGGKHMAMRQMVVTRDGERIVPGEWDEIRTDGVETRLLNQLWAGYFEYVARKYGWSAGLRPPG